MQIKCSGCSATIGIPPEAAGKKVRCPKCQKVLAVPANAGASPQPKGNPAAAKPKSTPTPSPGAAAGGKVIAQCPSCSKKLQVPASAAGKKVKCPGCNTAFAVPSGAPAAKSAGSSSQAAPKSAAAASAPASLAPIPQQPSTPSGTQASNANGWVPPWEDQQNNFGPSVLDELTDADMAPVGAVKIPGRELKPATSSKANSALDDAAKDYKKDKEATHASYIEGAKKQIWQSIGIYVLLGLFNAGYGGVLLLGVEKEAEYLALEGGEGIDMAAVLTALRGVYVLMIFVGICFFTAAATFMMLPMTSAVCAIVAFIIAVLLALAMNPLLLINVYFWIRTAVIFGGLIQGVNNASYFRFVKAGGREKADTPEAKARAAKGNKLDSRSIATLAAAGAVVLGTAAGGAFYLYRSMKNPLPEIAQQAPNVPDGFTAESIQGVTVFMPRARPIPEAAGNLESKGIVTTLGTIFIFAVADGGEQPLSGDALKNKVEDVTDGRFTWIRATELNGHKGDVATLAGSTRFAAGDNLRAPLLNIQVFQDDGRLIIIGTAQEVSSSGNVVVGKSAEPELEEQFYESLKIGPKPAGGFFW